MRQESGLSKNAGCSINPLSPKLKQKSNQSLRYENQTDLRKTLKTDTVEDCRGDADKLCGDIEIGEGRLAQCLIDNKSELSDGCSEAVEVFEENN